MIIPYALGVPGLKRALILLVSVLPASLVLLSCGTSPSSSSKTSGLKDRAFLSQNVSAGTVSAGVYIVDDQNDVHPGLSPIAAGATPGMMVVTPNRTLTLVFSAAENQLTVIGNASEADAGHVTLPGFTESFVVSPDSQTAYIAVPTASVVGQSPGVVKVLSLSSGAFTAELDIPAVRFLSMGNTGNRVLAFSDNSNSAAAITPSNIGTGNPVVAIVGGFDRPVAAFFSNNDNTAYVVNCGPECGGTQASVQQIDLTTNTLVGAAVNVDAASVALVDGTTMYLAGTPAGQSCTGQTTAASTCGLLTVLDLTSMTVTKSGIVITDGYHNRIALTPDGQLFVGAHTCTEIVAANQGDEVRGCLSIYNTQTDAVVIPPANGDATGIQPIARRAVVYVVQGGALGIYDTPTDKLQTTQILTLIGQFVDVKTVDF